MRHFVIYWAYEMFKDRNKRTISQYKKTMNKTDYETTFGINDEYYKYIFKKTEKIVCAVFYITRNETSIKDDDLLIKDLEETSQGLIKATLSSLTVSEEKLAHICAHMTAELVSLQTKLQMVHAAGQLPADLLQVFVNEIDTVHRTLRKYVHRKVANPLLNNQYDAMTSTARPHHTASKNTAITQQQSSQIGVDARKQPVATDRGARIRAVLTEQGQASVKDVSDVVTDCSEKTIQRELATMIKDGIVVREGERRWSMYSVI